MMRKWLFILCAVLALAICALGVMTFLSSSMVAYRDTDPTYNRAYWVQELGHLSARNVYAEFKKRNETAPLGRQHFGAHVIGSLIAQKEGVKGITICDSSFGFGCFHGLFGYLIAEGGVPLIKSLDAQCVEAFGVLGTGCQHGIGHGILEYTGYTKLNDALALCSHTTETVPLLGCSSGVFMEYNAPLTGNADALVPSTRQFDAAHPYAPCTDVAEKYQASCYFELGGWLHEVFAKEYTKIGAVCAGLKEVHRTDCFLGVGAGIPAQDGYDVDSARSTCGLFSSLDETSCRAGVRWAFYQEPQHRAEAPKACAGSDTVRESACERLGDLTEGKGSA